MLVNLEPLLQLLVAVYELDDLLQYNVCLVLLCCSTEHFAVFVSVKIAVKRCKNTIDE